MSSGPITETVTLSQAKELIRCLAHEQSVLLLSPPGVGKSDVVRQAAADAGLECKSLLGTQIAPEDVSGVPRIVGERSVFCPPRVLLPEDPRRFCLFLDELPACAPDVQKAFYSLLLERRLGGLDNSWQFFPRLRLSEQIEYYALGAARDDAADAQPVGRLGLLNLPGAGAAHHPHPGPR